MNQFAEIFHPFYLHKIANLNISRISSYSKAEAFTLGAIKRYKRKLYKSQKYFIMDLQTIMDFDAQSAMVVFREHNDLIKFQEFKENQLFDSEPNEDLNRSVLSQKMRSSVINKEGNPHKKQVLVQCVKCGKYTKVYKFCPECQQIHYCSETCQVNFKITHKKQDCRKNLYPHIFNPLILEIHFGSDLGHNIQVYFQHESRMSSFVRGKKIMNQLFQYFKQQKQSSIKISKLEQGTLKSSEKNFSPIKQSKGKLSQLLIGYDLILHSQQAKQSSAHTSNLVRSHFLEFRTKNQKEYQTYSQKKDQIISKNLQISNIQDLELVYSQNPILQEIELYLLKEGALMYDKIEQIHNNHVHYVYNFRFF